MSLPKNPTTTRIYFQNVNGITLYPPSTWETTCTHLQDMEVDIALLAEHKLDTSQPQTNKYLFEGARKIFGLGSFTITATSTPIRSPTLHKPGGILSIIHGSIKGRILESGHDIFGCWVFTKLRCNTGPPLIIITTYQVVQVDPFTAGPTTYANQLHAAYTQTHRLHPHQLRQHHSNDLISFVLTCQAAGDLVIVAGDFNET